jgi:hypothetical protein
MTIEELCRRSYDTAFSKGWHEEKRTIGEAISLFHSEVSEALECFRDRTRHFGDTWYSEEGKPEGVVVELADFLIRIGDTAVDMNLPVVNCLHNTTVGMLGYGRSGSLSYCDHEVTSFTDMLAVLHIHLSKAFDTSLDNKNSFEVACHLARAMNDAGGICWIHHWDLEKAVIEKMEHNATRPHRHGGKRA